MEIIGQIDLLRDFLDKHRQEGKVIGFVPTMGYFHQGHITLMDRAREECQVVVVSIFVNPTQFAANEDLDKYPRDLERDLSMAREAGVDCIFVPDVQEMYPQGYATYVDVERLTGNLCGRSRPNHFRGVTTVVSKLFHIVGPHKSYFGQKDAQQVLVIRRMVRDLNIPVEVITVPTAREEDGLAMSSRNVYLSPLEREHAVVLFRSLHMAQKMVTSGERNAKKIISTMQEMISAFPETSIDYIEICNTDDLEPIDLLRGEVLIALAVRIGATRLIDNIILEV
ncbi:MAG: pantoate--beta-alanine ligase [Bacillota bacterium]